MPGSTRLNAHDLSSESIAAVPLAAECVLSAPSDAAARHTHERVLRFWALMHSNRFDRVAEVLAQDFTLHWPQSGESIRGAADFAAMNAGYPAHGPWRFALRRLLVDGERAVTEVTVTDGVQRGLALSFFALREGRIAQIVEYWPEAFPARPERAGLVRVDPAPFP